MIRSLWMSEAGENRVNANADVLVELEDGRRYAFTAYTPLNLMSLMDREKLGYFVSDGMLVVRELTEENVRAAITEILDEHDPERFGVLQRS